MVIPRAVVVVKVFGPVLYFENKNLIHLLILVLHALHATAFAREYFPATQLSQSADPSLAANFPGVHLVQNLPFLVASPTGHFAQMTEPETAA